MFEESNIFPTDRNIRKLMVPEIDQMGSIIKWRAFDGNI